MDHGVSAVIVAVFAHLTSPPPVFAEIAHLAVSYSGMHTYTRLKGSMKRSGWLFSIPQESMALGPNGMHLCASFRTSVVDVTFQGTEQVAAVQWAVPNSQHLGKDHQ